MSMSKMMEDGDALRIVLNLVMGTDSLMVMDNAYDEDVSETLNAYYGVSFKDFLRQLGEEGWETAQTIVYNELEALPETWTYYKKFWRDQNEEDKAYQNVFGEWTAGEGEPVSE